MSSDSSSGTDILDDQTNAVHGTVTVTRAQLEELVWLLEDVYRQHPNRILRGALNKLKPLLLRNVGGTEANVTPTA